MSYRKFVTNRGSHIGRSSCLALMLWSAPGVAFCNVADEKIEELLGQACRTVRPDQNISPPGPSLADILDRIEVYKSMAEKSVDDEIAWLKSQASQPKQAQRPVGVSPAASGTSPSLIPGAAEQPAPAPQVAVMVPIPAIEPKTSIALGAPIAPPTAPPITPRGETTDVDQEDRLAEMRRLVAEMRALAEEQRHRLMPANPPAPRPKTASKTATKLAPKAVSTGSRSNSHDRDESDPCLTTQVSSQECKAKNWELYEKLGPAWAF